MTLVVLITALIAWVGGYQFARNPNLDIKDSFLDSNKIISPPKWLFYLCGAPKSQKYPMGNLIMSAVRAQIMGISLGIFAMMVEFFNPSRSMVLLGFGLTVFLPYVITNYFSKQYEAK